MLKSWSFSSLLQTTTWTTPAGLCLLMTAGPLSRSPIPQAWAHCPTAPTPLRTPGKYLTYGCIRHCQFLLFSFPCRIVKYEPRITPCLRPRPQSVPQPVVSGRHHPHPFRLFFRLHTRRSDLPVLEGILLHGPYLVSARFLALLHVRPQPGRGGRWGRPVRELHRQAYRILDACRPELLIGGSGCSFVSTRKDRDCEGARGETKTNW